ncbi:MAG TPA: hypothetical protein VIT44_00250 [Cyclobacteriaceae bacterium]
MLRYLLIIVMCIILATHLQGQSKKDTTQLSSVIIVPRLNSAGYFPFTGALLNHNTNFDVNFVYEHQAFGLLLFKSVDLQEKKSPINYLQTALFKHFPVGKTTSLRVFFGYVFSQTQAFRDEKDSDYFGAVTFYWDINSRLRLENIILYNDITIQQKIVNRLLLMYTLNDFRFDFSIHERIVFETAHWSTSAVWTVNFPKLKLTKHLAAQTTVAYQNYLTHNRPGFALKNGFLFSLSFPLQFN